MRESRALYVPLTAYLGFPACWLTNATGPIAELCQMLPNMVNIA